MKHYINITPTEIGSYSEQTFPDYFEIPDGWIEIPDELFDVWTQYAPWVNIIVENGILIGIEPNQELIDSDPLPKFLQIEELKKTLSDNDYKITKCQEYSLVGKPLPYDIFALHQTRETIRTQINMLEAELNE